MVYRRERGNPLLTMEKKPLTRDAGADNADGQLQKVSTRNAFDFAIHSLDHGAELEKASYKRTQAQAINERKIAGTLIWPIGPTTGNIGSICLWLREAENAFKNGRVHST